MKKIAFKKFRYDDFHVYFRQKYCLKEELVPNAIKMFNVVEAYQFGDRFYQSQQHKGIIVKSSFGKGENAFGVLVYGANRSSNIAKRTSELFLYWILNELKRS